jgi:2-oxoglutarate dehydrogenase E1 component
MATDISDSSILTGANSAFIQDLYAKWLQDAGSVDGDWASFFGGLNDDAHAVLKEHYGASWAPKAKRAPVNGAATDFAPWLEPMPVQAKGKKDGAAAAVNDATAPAVSADQIRKATLDSIRALMLIRAYRVRGHLMADLDPLGLTPTPDHPELNPATYGFTDADWDRPIFIDKVLGLETATLREILQIVRQTYCDKIGVEFMHIQDPAEKAWIQERVEKSRGNANLATDEKRSVYSQLAQAEGFEKYLQLKYTGTKRFGLEGGEAMIPALEAIIHTSRSLGVEEIVLGMPHRGRLNVLTNIMGKSYRALFSEFQGNPANPEDVGGSGDVKYHLGTSGDREFEGHTLHLSLNPNPSHLEAVDPVVVGKVRAKQQQRGDLVREKVIGVLMHGDASFAGQGLVAETFCFSGLRGYRSGGTVHLIVNNQIGFTTSPGYSRSSPYPSDVAKTVQAPIFHVNGDHPEAVVHVARLAAQYRDAFKKDVVIDMFCYRRHGHNEGDEPSFTQPLMYRKIAAHPTTQELYAKQLVSEGVYTAAEVEAIQQSYRQRLDEEFDASKAFKPNKADWLEGSWRGFEVASGDDRRGNTAVEPDVLKAVGKALYTVPENFKLHSRIARQLEQKAKMFETGEEFDWSTAEALAFGTLVREGTSVRLSGQDSGRGTFSQRHSVLVNQENEERYVPLTHVDPKQAPFEVVDSPLSEASVLGFEYGYSIAEPNSLVLWEAQFGDFANGAQVIIDQFISSGESKWLRMSGLVMLLPHGYEGQGPEHSSARLERYLQACGDDNWQVVYCTTPANYFHVLRRQVRRNFRKPLVIMTPKSLLRHKLAVSTLADMGPGTTFHRVIGENGNSKMVADEKVRRVVLCSGKVYYDLYQTREERGINDVALVRVEQLYPFPVNSLTMELGRYPNADVVWCQEEPKNMGSWYFVDRRIEGVLAGLKVSARRPSYAGRPESASPATGLLRRHNREQAQLVDEALTVK